MDTLAPQVPAPAAPPASFGLKARIETPTQVRLGDTIDFTVHVTWTSAPHAWLLLPQNSPETRQLSQVSMGMEQTRQIENGKEIPEILVKYRLVAKDTGTATVPSLTYDIPLASGGASHVVITPTKIRVDPPAPVALFIAIGGALVLLVVALLHWRRKRANCKQTTSAQEKRIRDFKERFETLASRVAVAEPRAWMAELEGLCVEARNLFPAPKALQLEALQKLEEAFAKSRYGGGPRDSWETKEWLRTARAAWNIHKDEEEHNG